MGGVRGILLDPSVLLSSSDDDDVKGDVSLLPEADYLLRKLRYSKIPIALSHGEALPSAKAMGIEALTVGYTMKPSREYDFAKRGVFPLNPTQNGLVFLPLYYDLPISSQLQHVDAVLHKATDEMVAVDMNSYSELNNKVTFTRNLQELLRFQLAWKPLTHRADVKSGDPVFLRLIALMSPIWNRGW